MRKLLLLGGLKYLIPVIKKAKKLNYYWVRDKDRVGVDKINALELSTTSLASTAEDFAKFTD